MYTLNISALKRMEARLPKERMQARQRLERVEAPMQKAAAPSAG